MKNTGGGTQLCRALGWERSRARERVLSVCCNRDGRVAFAIGRASRGESEESERPSLITSPAPLGRPTASSASPSVADPVPSPRTPSSRALSRSSLPFDLVLSRHTLASPLDSLARSARRTHSNRRVKRLAPVAPVRGQHALSVSSRLTRLSVSVSRALSLSPASPLVPPSSGLYRDHASWTVALSGLSRGRGGAVDTFGLFE